MDLTRPWPLNPRPEVPNRPQVIKFREFELKLSRGVLCPHRLVGKKCSWSCRTRNQHWIDHAEVWLKDGVPHIFMSHPYGLSLEDMGDILVVCAELDLEVNVDAFSHYYPSATVEVKLYKHRGLDSGPYRIGATMAEREAEDE